MKPNQIRARRCARAIARYGDDLLESNLIDFLTDAMHCCDAKRLDFQRLLDQARRHYANELNDHPTEERRLP